MHLCAKMCTCLPCTYTQGMHGTHVLPVRICLGTAELLSASVALFALWDSPAVPAPAGAHLQGMEQVLEGAK